MRYFIELAYNGSNFHGWQIQPNALTVQEVLEDALWKTTGQRLDIVGAGRTDTGVHSAYYVAHIDLEEALDELPFVEKMNRILPRDIVVFTLSEVDNELHARFDALSRTYYYHLLVGKHPFMHDLAYRPGFKLDFEKMNFAAQTLFDFTDFTSFSKLHTDVHTNNCIIERAEWVLSHNGWVFVITANRFLRNMVRAVVGTLLEVGKGKLSIEGFREIIESKNRSLAGTSVPAQGLFLADIRYDNNRFNPRSRFMFQSKI